MAYSLKKFKHEPWLSLHVVGPKYLRLNLFDKPLIENESRGKNFLGHLHKCVQKTNFSGACTSYFMVILYLGASQYTPRFLLWIVLFITALFI